VAAELRTSRGLYRLDAAAPLDIRLDDVALTAMLERADGIERVVLRFCIALRLLDPDPSAEELIARLLPWVEREFEQIREAALKSIRSERKLLEIVFDDHWPGPFRG
jgi:hypothetical protein